MMRDRNTHLKDESQEAPADRPVFGRDVPCFACKGRGTKFDQAKNERYPCRACDGKGYRREG